MNARPSRILPIIVGAQFLCTSLWFAGNAVLPELTTTLALPPSALGHLTSAVQFGFILGTFLYALLTIADRFSPSRVFFLSSLAAALANLGIATLVQDITGLLFLRFLTGFFLAGIYPVGMKIAADYFERELGKALGFLVGALVVGTAFPHLLRSVTLQFSWQTVLFFTSAFSLAGGLLIWFLVPDGPFRKKNLRPDLTALFQVFRNRAFRSAAFGYFGHMWELYAFWAFVPVLLVTYSKLHPQVSFNVPLLSFFIIGSGGLSCVSSGYISRKLGPGRTAFLFLSVSFLCCLISPVVFQLPGLAFIAFLIIWGLAVVADSPMFSALVAQLAVPESKGTALTVVTCLGFSITILSIQLLNLLSRRLDPTLPYVFLGIGPALGLLSLLKLVRKS